MACIVILIKPFTTNNFFEVACGDGALWDIMGGGVSQNDFIPQTSYLCQIRLGRLRILF